MPFDPTTAKPVAGFDPSTAKVAPAADSTPEFGDAFSNGLADTATFGLANRLLAASQAGLSHVLPGPAESYDEAYARIKGNQAKVAGNSPAAALAGDAAGVLAGGGAVAAGARMLRAAPVIGPAASAVGDALALQKGAPIANTLKSAATGATFGAADAAGHGGNADQIGMSAATGAVAAPIISKVATTALKVLSPATAKAMALLADKIGETPDVLERAFNNFRSATGRVPTMAEIVGLRTSGELRKVASDNSIVGEAATQTADAVAAARPTTLSTHIENATGQPAQDISTLVSARTNRMNTAMAPIRDNAVGLDASNITPLHDPRVRAATNGDPALRNRIGDAIQEVEDSGSSTALTVNDIDAIRKSVRGRQSAYANPQATIHNPHTAQSYGELADDVSQLASHGTPAYADALSQFEADSHYIKGFKHGMAGKDVGEAADPSLIHSLGQPEGREGYASGIQSRLQTQARSSEAGARSTADSLRQDAGTLDQTRDALGNVVAHRLQRAGAAESTAADRLGTIAPGAPNPTAQPSAQQAAQGVAAAMGHSPAGIAFHLSRAIPGLSKSMSPAVQRRVVQYLLDPAMTQQGIALLRRAGARDADLRRLALSISGNVGANAGEALTGGQ